MSSPAFPDGSVMKNLPAMQVTCIQSLGGEDPLEGGMETYASILAWRNPGTEEPGELQSMGSQRAGHNWKVWECMHTCRAHTPGEEIIPGFVYQGVGNHWGPHRHCLPRGSVNYILVVLFFSGHALGLSCSMQDLWSLLQPVDSLVSACGLFNCGMWDLVPRPGIEPGPSALGVLALDHQRRPLHPCLELYLRPDFSGSTVALSFTPRPYFILRVENLGIKQLYFKSRKSWLL